MAGSVYNLRGFAWTVGVLPGAVGVSLSVSFPSLKRGVS
jgi:hypothetical protein